jgi:hypothetical protein
LNWGGFISPQLHPIKRAPGWQSQLGISGSDEADDKLLLS